MRLLISTIRGLFMFDRTTGDFSPIKRPTPCDMEQAYGITWGDGKCWIGWKEPFEVIEYDTDMKPTGRAIKSRTPVRHGMHQMAWRNGLLYITWTEDNAISVFNTSDLSLEHLWIPDRTKYRHWNSIRVPADGLTYLLAHNYNEPPSELFVYKGFELVDRKEAGNRSHNIFWIGGKGPYVLSSLDGEALGVSDGERIKISADKFIRGICIMDNEVLIGFGHRDFNVQAREDGCGGVFCGPSLDNCNKPLIVGIPPVTEIRCLNKEDAAHDSGPLIEKGGK